jgi:F-type H+-transporting ATPase subunit gamma
MIFGPMGKTREIKGRMKAVANIRRITRTMQLIATARYQAAFKRVVASRPFNRKLSEMVGELSATLQAGGESVSFSHPLLKPPATPVGRELLLIITSNRGLCGGYNGKVFHAALNHLRANPDRQYDLELVGKKGLALLRFNKREASAFHVQFGDKPAYDEAEKLADRYMAEFTEGRYDAVRVVYTSFQSAGRQTPAVMQLLPLEDPTHDAAAGATEPAAVEAKVDYDFSPDPEGLLHELLPMTVRTMLFQAFNEAILSEQIARMVAMKAATDAAGKMGKLLTRQYNRARQTAITTELMEVISGAAALG